MVAAPKAQQRISYVELTPIRRKPLNRGTFEWGRYLMTLRVNRLLTQRELAKLAGLHVQTICNTELGISRTRMHILRKLRTALKLDDQPLEAFLPEKWQNDVMEG